MNKLVTLWIAALSALLLSASLINAQEAEEDLPPQTIHYNVHEAEEVLSGAGNFVPLDVRTQQEYADGHLADAIHIDYYADDFKDQVALLDKDATYVVYCRSGSRSKRSVKLMREVGIENIAIMDGGFRAWKARDKAIAYD